MSDFEKLENRGIDPRTSRMLSERSTIWASSPDDIPGRKMGYIPPQNIVYENGRV